MAEDVLGNNRAALDTAFGSVIAGNSVTLGPKQTISFAHGDGVIVIDDANLILQGGFSAGFNAKIGSLSSRLLALGDNPIISDFQNVVAAWRNDSSYNNSIAIDFLSGITGTGKVSVRPQNAPALNDGGKWLTTPGSSTTDASSANGLSLRDLRFGDVAVEYTAGRYVNGLIGNDNLANGDTSLGDITGNVFNNIDVTLKSTLDTNYLAGGGVIGVRSTGELSGSGNAEMGVVSGNIFDSIAITTTNNQANSGDFDLDHTYDSAYLEGGGLIGVNGASSPGNVNGHAFLAKLSNNYFTNIDILSNDILLGGGLVGVNNNSKHDVADSVYAMMGTPANETDFTQGATGGVIGNVFGDGTDGDINVRVGYSIRGGGVVGMNGLSNAAVDLVNLQDNAFAGISVESGSYIKGGGIVGLQTNDGGIPGSPNDPNNDAGHDLGTPGNPFTMTAAPATIRSATGNIFLNQKVSAGLQIEGSGVIGLRSNLGVANLGTLEGNVFKTITVSSGNATLQNDETTTLSGGGVVGLSATTNAYIGDPSGGPAGGIRNNVFDGITVNVGKSTRDSFSDNYLNGGGIIGVHARDNDPNHYNQATINSLDGNSFTNSAVTALSIAGGGIVGVNAGGAPDKNEFTAGLAALGAVNNNVFDGLTITTTADAFDSGHLEGGGVIGLWNRDSTGHGNLGIETINEIDNNLFRKINVTAGTYLQGGGIIGIRGSGLEQMGSITRNTFTGNKIEAGTYIDGGGVIGVTSIDGTNPVAGIELIGESTFTDNDVTAGADVFGGLVYTYGLTNVNQLDDPDGGMTIRNSQFSGNTFTSTNGVVYGTVTVDTGAEPYSDNGKTNGNALTLTATSGNSTVFRGNRITDKADTLANSRQTSSRANSLYFGTIPNPTPGAADPAAWTPTLIVDPAAGGSVELYDPIWVNQADPDSADDTEIGDNADYSFNMNVRGAGDFVWGGTNVFTLDSATPGTDAGTAGEVTLEAGSTTTLLDETSTTTFVAGRQIAGTHVATMTLDAPNFKFTLEKGATLNVEGHNRLDLSGAEGTAFAGADPRGETVANLNGTLHFNLNNTEVYKQGELPAGYAGEPLLTIAIPDNGQGKVDLADSTVDLGDFKLGTRALESGDRFYLIEVENTMADDPANKAFTGANPTNDTDTVRHGNLTTYTFTIDKNLDNLGNEENTRFLVARLTSVDPGAGAPPTSTARVPGITILQRTNDWLTNIPFYDFPEPDETFPASAAAPCPPADPCAPANPCDPCNPCSAHTPAGLFAAGTTADWVWTSFAEIKGSWFRAAAHETGHADVRGSFVFAGLAAQRRTHNGSVHFGAFFDAGRSNYDTYNAVAENNALRHINGEGRLDNIGGGLAFRRNWDNGLRLDVMARGGVNKNRFFSRDLADTATGDPVRFTLHSAYAGAAVGLGYDWKIDERNRFGVRGRYSWLVEEGDAARFSSGEIADFDSIQSHRGTVGARWTHDWNSDWAGYAGAAYEYEFDGKVKFTDRTTAHNVTYDGVDLTGGTGIGELGATYRRGEHLSVTAGLEGYVGKREGFGAFLSAAWSW